MDVSLLPVGFACSEFVLVCPLLLTYKGNAVGVATGCKEIRTPMSSAKRSEHLLHNTQEG